MENKICACNYSCGCLQRYNMQTVMTKTVNDSLGQGVKHDQGKPDMSMLSQELLVQVARVREFGAKKYSRGNWRKGFKYTRSISAALRHIVAFNEGQDLDEESGLSHIAHAICCLEHLLNDIKNNPSNDDRKE